MKTRFFSSMRFCLLLLVFISTLPALAWGAQPAAGHDAQGTVLILNSFHPGFAWSDEEQAGIIDVFQAKDKNWLPVIEYLDLKRLPDWRHLAELKQLFRRKYQNQKFSVAIAMDNSALEFAIDNQAELFRNAPIVFCGINNYTPSMLKGHTNVTGIVESIDIAGTIEVMLRLHPAAREIFVPHDYTATGLALRKEIEALVPRFSAKVRFRFVDPLTMEELLKELERLPGGSLVLAIGFITDKSGRTFGVTEITKLFSEHSPVPIYSTFEQRLGFGIVGGKLLSARHHGAHAARIALRVLAGEKASAIPVAFESHSQFMFDYKVMSRFGIPLSALPEGSIVINKPVSFYTAHRVVIQTALGVIGILITVIFLLTVIIIQRRRSAIALRASEAKYYDLYENAPDMFLSVDAKTATIIGCNNTLAHTIGYAKEEMFGRSILEMYTPDCREYVKRLFQQFATTGEVRNAELMIRCKDGRIIDVSLNTSAVRDKECKITHSRSIWRDITVRKEAENALRESEERLRFHTDNSPMAVVEWNTDFIVTRWTGAAEKMFGWSCEETIGKPIMELRMIYEEDIPIVQSVMQRLTDGKSKHVVSSNRNYTKKGEVIHCEWYNSVGHDSAGKMRSVISQVLDITGRKRAEIRLARLNDCFLQFGVSPDDNINRLVAVCGEQMNATCALYNRLGKNLLCSVGQWRPPAGFKSEDKPNGHICYDVIQHGGEHPLLVRNLQESPYARTDPNVLSYGLQTYLGMVVKWKQAAIGSLCVVYQTDIAPSNDDLHLMTIIASAIAVEEYRRQAEEALRRAEGNFRRSLDDSPLGVRIVTIQGETVYANRALLNIYGYDSIEELRATPLKERYTPESYAEFRIRQEKRRQGEYDPFEYEVSIVRKNGEVCRLQVFRKEILWNGERQFQTIYQDITERKQMEEELKHSYLQLRALADRLQRVSEETRIAIAREIHDQLGGGLTGLKMDLSWLLRGIRNGNTSEEQVALLMNRIRTSSELVDQMIHVVRRIATELRPSILDDLGLIAALEWQLQEFMHHTGIQIEFATTLEDVTLEQDIATAVFRIFQEALTNVARHSKATKVTVCLGEEDGTLFLEIMDNGRGITNRELLDTTSLGLLGMRERSLVFGGELLIAGEPGKGTTVLLKIPLKQGETP